MSSFPLNQQPEEPTDLQLIQAIFKSPTKTKSFIDSFKPAIIGAIIAIILFLPVTTSAITACGCESNAAIYAIKGLAFIILFYLFGNQKSSGSDDGVEK